MKQFRDTKEGKALLNRTVVQLDLSDVVGDMIHPDDAVNVIKIIDESAEDWDVTRDAFNYFLSQIMAGIKSGAFDNNEWITDDLKRLMKLTDIKLSKK
jgi:hypothetical protein